MKKSLKLSLIFGIFSLLLLNGCKPQSNLSNLENYEWNSEEDKKIYENAQWVSGNFSRLGGFLPQTELKEKKTQDCIRDDASTTYLRREGGKCGIGFWLEKEKGSKIDSVEKLKKMFGPIDNQAEAVSFVAVMMSDLKLKEGNESQIPAQTAKIKEDYLIQVKRNNTFGCGPHLPTGEIYLVTSTGDVKVVAFEKEVGEGIVCVD